MDVTLAVAGIAALVVVFAAFYALWLLQPRRYMRAGPDEALIVYGRRTRRDKDGFRVIVGGGTLVIPLLEEARRFPLHAMQLDVWLREVASHDEGIRLNVDSAITVKVPVTPDERAQGYPSVRAAIASFLRYDADMIHNLLTRVIAGHLRTAIASASRDELRDNLARFSDEVRGRIASDLASFGYAVQTFAIESIAQDHAEPAGEQPEEAADAPPGDAARSGDRDITLTLLDGVTDEEGTPQPRSVPPREKLADALREYAHAGLSVEEVKVDLSELLRGVPPSRGPAEAVPVTPRRP